MRGKESRKMTIWLIVGVVGWIICGILAYGVMKNALIQLDLRLSRECYSLDEIFICCLSVMGPICLLSVILETWIGMRKLGLCFRLPKELCEPRHPK